MKTRTIILTLCALALASSTWAQPPQKMAIGIEAQDEVMLTVYNNNYGLVRELRTATLPEGIIELEFRDVAEAIDPTSVAFKSLTAPDKVAILEQNYRYDLLTPHTMLDKFIGKPIKITHKVMKNNSEERVEREGTLLSTNGGTVIRFYDSYEINPEGSITLKDVPDELLSKPTLVWLLRNGTAEKQQIETSYLTNNMTWKADYVAVINKDDAKLDLTGWVTLDNRSGATYRNAKLKLVAGDVQRVAEPPGRGKMAMRGEMAVAAMAEPQFEEKSFFEYHLYTLGRTTTLANNETKQMTLLEGPNVPVKKVFVFDSASWQMSYGPGWSESKKVSVVVELENKKENNLGMALPAGRVRVYKADDDASLQLVGEDRIDHTPKDEKIRLKLGEAFDVVGERKQTDQKQLSQRMNEMSYTIELRNHKAVDIEVTVIEHAYGDWEVVKESHPHKKRDSQTLEFKVPVPKNGATTVSYTVRTKL